MSHLTIVGAVLRIDLRGFSGDLPLALGTPMRDEPTGEGTRSLFYDLCAQAGEGLASEACLTLARFIDRVFVLPETPPFAQAFACKMKLELGLGVDASAQGFAHDVPHALLDCLGAAGADLGLSYYPLQDDPDAIVEEI